MITRCKTLLNNVSIIDERNFKIVEYLRSLLVNSAIEVGMGPGGLGPNLARKKSHLVRRQ